jgi:hypothetical protein
VLAEPQGPARTLSQPLVAGADDGVLCSQRHPCCEIARLHVSRNQRYEEYDQEDWGNLTGLLILTSSQKIGTLTSGSGRSSAANTLRWQGTNRALTSHPLICDGDTDLPALLPLKDSRKSGTRMLQLSPLAWEHDPWVTLTPESDPWVQASCLGLSRPFTESASSLAEEFMFAEETSSIERASPPLQSKATSFVRS